MKNMNMSEAFITSAFLAFSGGLQDSYTYYARDKVFANVQTGNLVIMSQNLMEGNFAKAITYLCPILAFMAGVFLAEQLEGRFIRKKSMHWQQNIVIIEIVVLAIVGFIPTTHNNIANMLVSFACALQLQSFRMISGNIYASTMCTGNIKSGTAALSAFLRTGKTEHLMQCMQYLLIIIIFAAGAGLSAVLSLKQGVSVIWISCFVLIVPLVLMHNKEN